MLKVCRIENKALSKTLFHIHEVNSLEFCSYIITVFGRTFQIKYSSKLNYFYIAQQVRRNRLMIDSLSMAFVRHILIDENKIKLENLERIHTVGCSSDFYMKGSIGGEEVFIKVNTSRVQTDTKNSAAMQNEYEKSVLRSELCTYVPKPLYYIKCVPCEILITPYIHNIRPLNDLISSEEPMPSWVVDQLNDLIDLLKRNRLVHRDINGGNISVGNLSNGAPQIFLNDLAYMTYLDDDGNPIPTNVENKVDFSEDGPNFDCLLNRIREKMEHDKKGK